MKFVLGQGHMKWSLNVLHFVHSKTVSCLHMAYKLNHFYYKRHVCHSCILTPTVNKKTQQVKRPAPQDLNLHYKWTFACRYSYN